MEILLRTLQVQDTLRSSLRAGLFISAARRAFFRPREDLRRVGERFSGGWGGGEMARPFSEALAGSRCCGHILCAGPRNAKAEALIMRRMHVAPFRLQKRSEFFNI